MRFEIEKMDLDQVECGSSKPTQSEEVKQNQRQGTSSSSSKATSGQDLNCVGDVEKIEDKLQAVKNEDSSSRKKKMKLQQHEEQEKDEGMEQSQEDPLDFDPVFGFGPVQKALAIELILIKVLENLDTKSLLNFRLVNKTWEKEATNIIMKGMKTRIGFSMFYRPDWIKRPKRQNLSEFYECIRKSRRFPCSSFEIILFNKDFKEFCTLHGSEVKRLESNVHGMECTKLGDILLHQVSNVQELRLRGNCEGLNKENRLFPENSVLPHLKTFSYNDFRLASQITRASPNLKQVWIQDYSLDGVETLMSMNKIHLLKEVHITSVYKKVVVIEKLADGNPKIEKIAVATSSRAQAPDEFIKRRFESALSKILESSKETMTHVELRPDQDFWMGLKWPKFEKVRDLLIISSDDNNDISANFISDVFPNIQRLKSGSLVPWLLNNDTPLAQLEEFEPIGCGNCNFDNLSLFAPNLTKLKISYVENFHEIAHSLWACSGLRELNISISNECYSFPQLDMAFTGLSEEMVRKLHGDREYFYDMKINKKEIPRIQLSILNCPDLVSLKIVILDKIYYSNLMTSVTGEFGFSMLENLRVEIWSPNYTLDKLDSLKAYARLSKR